MPDAFHGDAVACIGVGKTGTVYCDVTSWMGLLVEGGTNDNKLYIMGLIDASKHNVAGGTRHHVVHVACAHMVFAFL